MEKIYQSEVSSIFKNEYIVAELVEWLDLKTLFTKIVLLCKTSKEAIERENYLLFQKFRDILHIPTTFDTSDLAARENIADMVKAVQEVIKQEAVLISPFAYYTDGGVDTNSNYYFLQHLWKKTGICY